MYEQFLVPISCLNMDFEIRLRLFRYLIKNLSEVCHKSNSKQLHHFPSSNTVVKFICQDPRS